MARKNIVLEDDSFPDEEIVDGYEVLREIRNASLATRPRAPRWRARRGGRSPLNELRTRARMRSGATGSATSPVSVDADGTATNLRRFPDYLLGQHPYDEPETVCRHASVTSNTQR